MKELMNMKKFFVTIVMACAAISAMAVDLPKQGFGIQIGWAQPILRINDAAHKDTLNNVIKMKGFKVGVVYDGSFIAGFGTSIGLNYTFGAYSGGWTSRHPNYGEYPKDRMLITYHQLEAIVDWQYKFEVAKETYLILYTGPTIQCGLDLSMRIDTKAENPPMSGNITTTYGERLNAYTVDKIDDALDPTHIKENNALKRFNVTWGLGAGFQYKRYFLRGSYDFGLITPYKNHEFVDASGQSIDVYTRGRLDQWSIKLGVYLWYND